MRLWRRPTRVVGPPAPPPEGKPDAYPAVAEFYDRAFDGETVRVPPRPPYRVT